MLEGGLFNFDMPEKPTARYRRRMNSVHHDLERFGIGNRLVL